MGSAKDPRLLFFFFFFFQLAIVSALTAETATKAQQHPELDSLDCVVVSVTVNGNPTAGAGSTVHAVQGDTVVFTVALPADSVAVRWDGVGQLGTPTTTQSDAFTYTYKLVVDRPAATFTYHAHYGPGGTILVVVDVHGPSAARALEEADHGMPPPADLRGVDRYLESVVPADMIMADRREEEARVRRGGEPRSDEQDLKAKIKMWAKVVVQVQGANKKHAVVDDDRPRMGKPSIEAVAMAGGTVDWSDDDEPPYHLRLESLQEEHEFIRPPAFFFLGPPLEPAEPRVNVNRRHTPNMMAMWFNGFMLWVTAAVASSAAAIRCPSRDP